MRLVTGVSVFLTLGTVIDAKTTQPDSMDCPEGEDVNLPCNHSTIGGNDIGTVNNSMTSLTIASDRKSSTLVLPQVTLRDTTVYYCILREAQWDRRGCTCAVSLVAGRGGHRGGAVKRANLESFRRKVREQKGQGRSTSLIDVADRIMGILKILIAT
ncbi:hypothetical protein FD754_023219 [Muntiacus muntjak]|uniref:Immunoglobulin domain-containing protein n=1 Tax=Muntiacus muntjak TaxID=9888 RepID=A0A5N3UUD4_MUNMU|nr:hypothetical protein FD754_023219 [Muntiacus muntjak]